MFFLEILFFIFHYLFIFIFIYFANDVIVLDPYKNWSLKPPKVVNIGFDGYIGTWVLRIYRIYRRYIGGYFYINIGN